MGNYNPHIPQILGQEWVPIREQPLTLTPRTNLIEVGHGFTLATSRTIQTARFYLRDWPPDVATSQVVFASVYQRGTGGLSGPIQSVVIPCSLGTVAGGSVTLSGGASNIASALFSPSDPSYVIINTASAPTIDLRFDTESYLPQLIGKRILGIDFLYTYIKDEAGGAELSTDLFLGSGASGTTIASPLAPTNLSVFGVGTAIGRQTVGEVDYYWQAPTISSEVLPWSPNRLRAFDNGSGLTERVLTLSVAGNPPTASQSIWYGYAAIEVFFCEEQRVIYGGRLYGSGSNNYVLGANQITMRDLTDAINPILAPGLYDLALSSAELSDRDDSVYPELNQLRELYSIPPHPALRVIRPFPLNASLGKEFDSQETVLLPQLSLHTSGGPLTEVHVYGRQAAAQVYGNNIAAQEIYDTPVGVATRYPWVRWYARRFGDTVVPLKLSSTSPTVSGSSVLISPAEFDALDEIVDGWREITLRFPNPPTMGTGNNPQWRWSAANETPGSRWEVLGAYAPALSGAPFNPFNKVPSPHQLSIATYGAPASGSAINLSWLPQYAPPVSAVSDDDTADAMLIFARDMPTITGFSVSEQDQEVVGIGLDCGVNPCCIPSEIQYLSLSWAPSQATIAYDNFERTVSNDTWGNADSGQLWNTVGTLPVFSVADGVGQITFPSALNAGAYILETWTDLDATVIVQCSAAPSGNDITGSISFRINSANDNEYRATVKFNSDQSVEGILYSVSGGVLTMLDSHTTGYTFSTSDAYKLRVQAEGTILRMKIWRTTEPEPEGWNIISINSTYSSGSVGLHASRVSGNLNNNVTVSFDEFYAVPLYLVNSAYEIQRMDTVTTDWQTIMKTRNLAVNSFNDYEARVGIISSYRIRYLDPYDFEGPWSSTVTGMIEEPGVTIGCEGGHLLIFTSNEEQDGSLNLAYSSVWENQVEESFVFPEARFVELQAMYNRDFFTAFRPTERGGEQFTRTVLVQAAAINPETLADFTSLRDMAWANVSYICVRDEDGNRWFATVLVPGGRVVHHRKLYMAPVEIIEVTETPSEVDP